MKKILLSFLMVVVLFSSGVKPAIAQTSPWFNNPAGYYAVLQKGTASLENLSFATLINNANLLVLAGVGLPPSTQGTAYVPEKNSGGIAGIMQNMSLAMAQRPSSTSSIEYIADMGHDLGIMPKEALAQGTTFAGLSPILTIWKTMRDLVYLLYVVIFMVVGFMILLRKKIDPRTVISIESALPKLIISLILITFSYAIISFMVDLSNLASRIIATIFVGPIIFQGSNPSEEISKMFQSNIFYLARPIGDVLSIAKAVGKTVGNPGQVPGLTTLLGPIAELMTQLIFVFAIIFITFKIFFALLGPYVGIVLSIIFAPFELLMMAIPGSEGNVGNWLKNILSKVAVFPVAFFLLILAASFGAYNPSGNALCGGNGGLDNCFKWENTVFRQNAQNISLTMMPFGNWSGVIGDLIAFGILLTIPSVVQLVQNALKVKDQAGDAASQTIMKGMRKVPLLKGAVE
jgi:hypothetical protein